MGNAYLHLGVEAAVWLISMVSSMAAFLVGALAPARHFYLCLALGLATSVVGCLGYWRPSTWPSLGYMYESDSGWVLRLRVESFYILPLAVGVSAVLFTFWRRRHLNHAG
jgi:hypothetical protein